MLKLLIAACLVTHGLGRPDVSHILKWDHQGGQRQQQRNSRAFHPLDYLNRQLGNGREFEARAASESEYNVFDYLTAINGTEINGLEGKSSSPAVGRRSGVRLFRNIVQPSPFKKNTAEFGYTYEKPTDPFDFPINPDANLIKPVSTQAPEYLPPLEQGPLAGADEQPGTPGDQRPPGQSVASTTSPSYPGLASSAVTTEGPYGYPSPQGPSEVSGTPEAPAVQNQNGYGPPAPVTGGDQPVDVSNQPDSTPSVATQSSQNTYDQQGSTMGPNDQTTETSPDLKPTTGDEFTGYPQGPSSTPGPAVSSTSFPQGPSENQMTTEDGFTGYAQGPSSSPSPDQGSSTAGFPQAEVQTSTEGEFTGYTQGPSTTSSPDQGSTPGSSTGYPQEPSPAINGQQPTSDNQFTEYPQGPSTTPSSDRETAPPSTDYPQESSPSTNGPQTGYPQGSSSTPSPDQGQSTTSYPDGTTPTSDQFTGYPQGPGSTSSPDQGYTPGSVEPSTGYPQSQQPGVPDASQMTSNGYPQSPESGTPSENATTQKSGTPADSTVSTPTPLTTVGGQPSTQQGFDDQQGYNYENPFLPPNLTEVIGEPIDINELATTTLPSTTTRKPSDGYIIPPKPRPELVVPEEPQTSEQTESPSVAPIETTSRPIPAVSVPSSTSAPEYLPPEETNRPEEGYDTTQGPSVEQTTATREPSSTSDTSESTTAAASYSQETTTFAGYASSERETTTSSNYSAPSQESTTASGYPEITTFSGYPSVSQTTSNASDYPSSNQETTTTALSYPSSVGQEITTFGGYPNAEVSTPDFGISSGAPEYTSPSSVGSSTPSSEYQTTTGFNGSSRPEFSTFEPSDNVSAGGQPFPTKPSYEPVQSTTSFDGSEQPSSTAAPEYLPPDTNETSSQYYPPVTNTTADQPTLTPEPEYRPDQPVRPELPSDNLVNQTSPSSPDDFSQVTQSAVPDIPTMPAIISEINGLIPDGQPHNGYLPPYSADNAGLRIVVDDALSSNLFQPPSGRSSVTESDAEGSELQPQVALVTSTSEGYQYQAPEERLPAPVIPSHTLDDEGYHYKIPSIPFP